MRYPLLLAGIFVAVAGLCTPVEARNYPWCARYGGRFGGASNCGFTTFEQCLATVSGIGGFCERNTQYVPPAGPRTRSRHTRSAQ